MLQKLVLIFENAATFNGPYGEQAIPALHNQLLATLLGANFDAATNSWIAML